MKLHNLFLVALVATVTAGCAPVVLDMSDDGDDTDDNGGGNHNDTDDGGGNSDDDGGGDDGGGVVIDVTTGHKTSFDKCSTVEWSKFVDGRKAVLAMEPNGIGGVHWYHIDRIDDISAAAPESFSDWDGNAEGVYTGRLCGVVFGSNDDLEALRGNITTCSDEWNGDATLGDEPENAEAVRKGCRWSGEGTDDNTADLKADAASWFDGDFVDPIADAWCYGPCGTNVLAINPDANFDEDELYNER